MFSTRTWVYLSCAVAVIFMLAPRSFADVLNCSSDDGRRHYCAVDTRGGVQMVKQHSDASCQQGSTWDFDRGGIWVDRGCRADFQVGQGWGQGDRGYGVLSCSSDDERRHYCPGEIYGEVQVLEQRSGSACRQGYSWGYDRGGIWVDHGCRADFAITREWHHHHDQGGQVVTCSSDDDHRHLCAVDINGGVRFVQQRSGSPCELGRSWGFNQKGIWVDHGCRADFAIEASWSREDTGWDRDHDQGGNSDQDQILNCSSDDGRRRYCAADTRGGVQLFKQHSDAACQQNYSWGFDRGGIWVDHGCRADFQIVR
jgi:hypothetical protein